LPLLKVSVVIPCFNVARFIEDCLFSVYKQSYSNLEVICIDNNSNDDTLLVLNNLKNDTYPDLIILREESPGAPAARNKGLSVSSGDWIQFLDADDILKPNKIKHQIDIIKDSNDILFVAAASEYNNINGVRKVGIPEFSLPFVGVFTRQSGNTCSNIWNHLALKSIGGWDESITSSQETDLMLRMLELKGAVLIDKEPLTIINERDNGQISQGNPTVRWVNIVKIRKLALEKKSFTNLPTNEQQEVLSFYVSSLMILSRLDYPLSLEYASIRLETKLIAIHGLGKWHIGLIKLIGLRKTLKINSIFTK
jgi:glycosyltransferase involved in cell wall biosynthesis